MAGFWFCRLVGRRHLRRQTPGSVVGFADSVFEAAALWPRALIFGRRKVRHMLSINSDIMVRTLCLLLGFGWFTNRGGWW